MKETWKIKKDLLNNRSKSTNINSLKFGNVETVDKREISNTMDTDFCSVGEEFADKIEDCANTLLAGVSSTN